jgi:hypothetical protein
LRFCHRFAVVAPPWFPLAARLRFAQIVRHKV